MSQNSQMLQDIWSVPDHFGILCIKGLRNSLIRIVSKKWWIQTLLKLLSLTSVRRKNKKTEYKFAKIVFRRIFSYFALMDV